MYDLDDKKASKEAYCKDRGVEADIKVAVMTQRPFLLPTPFLQSAELLMPA